MIIRHFSNKEYSFHLKLGQIKALEKETNIGYYALYELLNFGKHSIDHILLILRLGLVGGGMESNEANTLVQKEVASQPFFTYVELARATLHNAIFGGDEVTTISEGKLETQTKS